MRKVDGGAPAKLAVDRLSVGYNKKPLIADISFSLQPGEILTLIGPNGAGKTTILKSITRHLALISGVVAIDGSDIERMRSKDVAGKLAVMLTARTKPELMTCRELIGAGRYPYTGSFGLLTQEDKHIVQKAIETLADEMKYSDPVSGQATEELETELDTLVSELQKAVIDGENEAALLLCKKARGILAERNRVCKLSKNNQ